MAQLNFDARQVAPQTGFEPVPAGWYNVVIDETEMKPTKEGNGSYLKVRYSILDGQYAGRKIYGMITLQNSNPQAVEIGLKQLSAVAHAVGHLLVQHSEELHGKPLKIKVKIRNDKTGEYEPQNSITQWENINAQVGDTAAPAAGAAPFAQPTGPAAGFPTQPSFPATGQPAFGGAPAGQPGMPAWGAAPAAAQPATPAGGQPWQQPAQGQPWAQPQQPQQPTQQPVQQQASAAAPAGAAQGGFNPQGAVPPWATR